MHCHEATRTLSAAQERKLELGERVSLQVHLAICPLCRDFDRQLKFLRETMRTYARTPDSSAGTGRDDHSESSE
jgi:anti-sigma factor ChrR (cupin superfamily)